MIVKGRKVLPGQTWEFTDSCKRYIVKKINIDRTYSTAMLQTESGQGPIRFTMADQSKWELIGYSPYFCVICKKTEAANNDYVCLDCDL